MFNMITKYHIFNAKFIVIFLHIFLYESQCLSENIISFSQQGSYCYFKYYNKPESGLKDAFKYFFESNGCGGMCGNIHVTVNYSIKTITWTWDNCGTATRSYSVLYTHEENIGDQCGY